MTENPMPNELDAVALERAAREALGYLEDAGVTGDLPDTLRAALASAKPAQAGEYEGLAKEWEDIARFSKARDPRKALLEAASVIRTVEAERARMEGERDQLFELVTYQRKRAESAEARVLPLETRLAAMGELPADVAASVLRIGRVEWGATAPLSDKEHVAHLASSIAETRKNFSIEGPTAFHGVYLEGTETVLCHTGISPNSPQHARILVGAWNKLVETARAILSTEANHHG